MLPAAEDLRRRRPVWEALADLFLDRDLDESEYRFIASQVLTSGYSPSEIQTILWEEVFPVVAYNLDSVAGVWMGFPADWLEERILHSQEKKDASQEPKKVNFIQEAWHEVLRYLPPSWSLDGTGEE
jgi:hypothetical protein